MRSYPPRPSALITQPSWPSSIVVREIPSGPLDICAQPSIRGLAARVSGIVIENFDDDFFQLRAVRSANLFEGVHARIPRITIKSRDLIDVKRTGGSLVLYGRRTCTGRLADITFLSAFASIATCLSEATAAGGTAMCPRYNIQSLGKTNVHTPSGRIASMPATTLSMSTQTLNQAWMPEGRRKCT